MSLLEAIMKNWPMKSNRPATGERIIACKENYITDYVVGAITRAHPQLDRGTIISAMQLCCKDVADPHYPRPFLLCLLRKLGLE
jgi:hypothetical protein